MWCSAAEPDIEQAFRADSFVVVAYWGRRVSPLKRQTLVVIARETVGCGARGLRSTSVHWTELAQILDMKRWMRMARLPDSTKVNLDNQGFCGLDDEAKSRYALPLRFTPGVGTALIAIGLVLQSPILLGAMALVTLSGVLFPRGMVLDLVRRSHLQFA